MDKGVTLHRAAEAATVWVLGDRLRFAGDLPGTGFLMVEIDVPPGSGPPLHRHASPELFRVLSGEVEFATADGAVTGRAGDVLGVAPHAAHTYRNAGSAPATLLVMVDRSMEAFFRDIGRDAPPAGPPGPEEMARIGAALARHGIEILAR
ncbi:cupin domain-containing protein [Falsiroseomonas oryzae]|uniref:cupin domain-containing protein n=1 Tax=Falsiroseomonas oryzae TaxID=2766473 RepID=UPI0022EB0A3F|nr:cupin domain-containing protein [Roseomonas sp. MO-31]